MKTRISWYGMALFIALCATISVVSLLIIKTIIGYGFITFIAHIAFCWYVGPEILRYCMDFAGAKLRIPVD